MLEFYYIERRLLKVVNNLYLFLLEQKTKEVAIILNNMWVLLLFKSYYMHVVWMHYRCAGKKREQAEALTLER